MAFPARLFFCSVLGSLVLVSAFAAEGMQPPSRPLQQALNTLSKHLELDAAQRQSLLDQRAAHQREWQPLTARAQALSTAQPAAKNQAEHAAALAQLCQESQTLHNTQRTRLREVLNAAQREKLQQLEAAFALMPLVDAAQAAGLMDDHLKLPPPGFPSGFATVATAWRRVQAAALPGCSGTQVLPEVGLKGGGESKRPLSPQR